MSWSIEEHIGDCRPFPAQVVVYKGETDECLAYVSGEVADRLKAENAKLRDLARLLLWGVDNDMPRDEELVWSQKVDALVGELGIEVCV